MTWLDERTLMIARTLREPTFTKREYEHRLHWVDPRRGGRASGDDVFSLHRQPTPMIRVPDCRRVIMDPTGRRYGRLTVLGYAGKRGRLIMWSCRCDCGMTGVYAGNNLVHGFTRSCGCLRRRKKGYRHAG